MHLPTVTCERQSLDNGIVSYDMQEVNNRYPVSTEATFHCNNGYIIDGYSVSTCVANGPSGYWDNQTPFCAPGN